MRPLTQALSTLLILTIIAGLVNSVAATQEVATRFAASRKVSMTIKVVFIGFNASNIDTQYLAWRENVPADRVNTIMIGDRETGVTYELSYEFVFADINFRQELLDFLRRTGVEEELENPWFDSEMLNVLYDANRVEEWLYQRSADYGGLPKNGYTFLIANLTDLPSVSYDQVSRPWRNQAITPHYYSVEYVDRDLAYKIRNRQFMTAWGGHYRLWFYDVSAGPSFNTPEDPPLQVVLKALNIDLNTRYGSIWLTQYLADYLWETVFNLAVPQFVHEPLYGKRYHLVVNVLDNRTDLERKAIPLNKTVNATMIESSYRDLLPYSEIEVSVNLQNVSSDQDLSKVVKDSFKRVGRETGYVDLRPVYRYLQLNLSRYVPRVVRDDNEITIPVFCFAFSRDYIAYTYKWQAQAPPSSLQGIALGDMVLISLTQYYELERGAMVRPPQGTKGIGFSQVIVHEVGHMLGLMHPFQFGQVSDFVDSPMSYFSHSYNFSQFDKDAIHRIHADKALLESSAKLTEAQELTLRKITMPWSMLKLSEARNLASRADQEYEAMNYVEAVRFALESKVLASQAVQELGQMPTMWPLALVYGIVVGIIVGWYLTAHPREISVRGWRRAIKP